MSTKKNEKKSVAKAVAKVEPKNAEPKKPETVTLSDGSTVKKEGAFIVNKDGTFDRCTNERLLEESSAAMTIQTVDHDTKEVKHIGTFGVHWRKTKLGGYVFDIATSKGLSDEVVDNEHVHGGKLTLIGRGDAIRAAFALNQVWLAWSSNFGIESAFRIVRVELDANDKNWYALVVPVTEVLG